MMIKRKRKIIIPLKCMQLNVCTKMKFLDSIVLTSLEVNSINNNNNKS